MKTKNRKVILIASGGTGGHIFPAISVSELLMKHGYRVVFVTDSRFLNFSSAVVDTVSKLNFSLEFIKIKNRKGLIGRFLMALVAFRSIFNAIAIILRYDVSSVVGFGGYTSLPCVIAGFLTRRKIAIHEQNAHLGLANRICIWFASVCMVGFKRVDSVPRFMKYKVIFTGNPVRGNIKKLHQDERYNKSLNHGIFFRVYNRINFLIIGGSQGTSAFSKFVPDAIAKLPLNIRSKLFVFHQAPEQDVDALRDVYVKAGVEADIRSFFVNIGDMMTSAHLLIARSGAGTISEIMCLGTPAILIPFPQAKNQHQLKNAKSLQEEASVVVMEQGNISSKKLADAIVLLFKDENLSEMSSSLRKIAVPNADINIATAIEVLTFGRLVTDFYEDVEKVKKFRGEKIGIS